MFAEDLDAFLSEDEHAVAAIYDGTTETSVLFEQAFIESLGVQTTGPAAIGKASVFGADCGGKTLLINGVTWTIKTGGREPLDDGAFVLLRLMRTS